MPLGRRVCALAHSTTLNSMGSRLTSSPVLTQLKTIYPVAHAMAVEEVRLSPFPVSVCSWFDVIPPVAARSARGEESRLPAPPGPTAPSSPLHTRLRRRLPPRTPTPCGTVAAPSFVGPP
ncbi:hypothetical protein EXIGLDRAFT_220898 [Exidia glandulosa HHB12029]|uniref:Uncharacterized protein n=1 Tax=Exidia glandulosa HHB12029 TaxID=1314781 RepID=A0A165MQ66_EXIGL|nr:hypothetical protein EXIGLDRAFT_220898 [Exidia glandulosa HHB12029]